MSTFLELTNKALLKLNEVPLTQADFSAARNVHAHAKNAVLEAVRDINNSEFKWPFNYSSYTYTLTPGVQRYAPPSSTRSVDFNTIRLEYSASLGSDNRFLRAINYEDYIRYHRINDKTADSSTWKLPYYCFRYPDDYIGISGIPDKAYSMTIDRYAIPVDMDAYNDECNIPESFDPVIINSAMYHLYMFRGNSEQAAIAQNKAKAGVNNMRTILMNHYENVSTTQVSHGRGPYFGKVQF